MGGLARQREIRIDRAAPELRKIELRSLGDEVYRETSSGSECDVSRTRNHTAAEACLQLIDRGRGAVEGHRRFDRGYRRAFEIAGIAAFGHTELSGDARLCDRAGNAERSVDRAAEFGVVPDERIKGARIDTFDVHIEADRLPAGPMPNGLTRIGAEPAMAIVPLASVTPASCKTMSLPCNCSAP